MRTKCRSSCDRKRWGSVQRRLSWRKVELVGNGAVSGDPVRAPLLAKSARNGAPSESCASGSQLRRRKNHLGSGCVTDVDYVGDFCEWGRAVGPHANYFVAAILQDLLQS